MHRLGRISYKVLIFYGIKFTTQIGAVFAEPHWRGCASPRQTAGWQGDSHLPAPPAAGDPDQLAQHPDIAARRQPLLLSGSSRLVSSQWSRLYPGRRADHDVA